MHARDGPVSRPGFPHTAAVLRKKDRSGPYTELDILTNMRPVCFLGSSLKSLRDFPEDARHDAGYQLEPDIS